MSSTSTAANPLAPLSPALQAKLARVKLLAMDVDGTLTDGSIHVGQEGEVAKRYDSQDGYGIHLAQAHGLRIAFVTGRNSPVVARRAAELGVEDLYVGCEDKPAAMRELAAKHDLEPDEMAFLGDDLPDAAVFAHVGVGIAVADATSDTRARAEYVTARPGGGGAVREVIELVFRCRGTWSEIVSDVCGGPAT